MTKFKKNPFKLIGSWTGLVIGHLLTVIMFLNTMLQNCNMDGGCANLDLYLYVLAPFMNFPGYFLMGLGFIIGWQITSRMKKR